MNTANPMNAAQPRATGVDDTRQAGSVQPKTCGWTTRVLGRTDIEVPLFGLGGLFVSCFGGGRERSVAAARRAIALGARLVDTAPGYGDSEEVLGEALAGIATPDGAPLVISTKIGGKPEPFLPRDAACLRRAVEDSLRRLRRDRVDLLMIHEPDRPGQYDWWEDVAAPRGPVLEVLRQLKREGVCRAIGVAGTTAYELARLVETGAFDVVLTAFNYSLLWREAEVALLPAARAAGVGVIAGSPLQQGALARRWDDEVRSGAPWLSPPRRAQFSALYRLVDECGIALPDLALRFVASNPDIASVLCGARSPEEVEASAAALAAGPLPAAVAARLDEIAAMVPFRPYEEPFSLPFSLPKGTAHAGPGMAR